MKDYWRKFHQLKSLLKTTKGETQMLLAKLKEEEVEDVVAGKKCVKANALLARARKDSDSLLVAIGAQSASERPTPSVRDVNRMALAILKCASVDAAMSAFEHAVLAIRRVGR